MRFKRVLLIFPSFESDVGSSRPSPSLGYIAQTLDDNYITYSILDMMLGYSFSDLKMKINRFKPDLIGITLFTLHHKMVYEQIAKIKFLFPNVKIVVGGPHATIEREKVIKECPSIDFVCVHEGEELIGELCRGDNLSEIKGLVFRENESIIFTGVRPYQTDLNKYSYPKLNKFELNKYASEIVIISSRGCPYKCIYCSVQTVSGKKIRIRDIKNVVDEIEYWYLRGKRVFNFLDDNFTFYEDRVYQFCDEVEKRNFECLIFRVSNGVRADKLNYQLLKRMKEIGFRSISIGVEAGNNKILKILKKGEAIEEIESAIKAACDLELEVSLFFVFGTPGETLEDVEDSIKLALKYPVFKVDFYNLLPFPGTELYKWVNENNAWISNSEELLDKSDKNIRFGSNLFFVTKELPFDVQKQLIKRLLKLMRFVEKRYLINILRKKFGLLSYPLAYLIATPFLEKLYFKNNKIRRIAENVRYSIIK